MNKPLGIGIYVDSARFVPANIFFKDCSVTEERTVQIYEVVWFLKNGGYAVINGKKYPIMAGSVRFHRPGDKVYSYRFNEIYVVHFTVDNVKKGEQIFSKFPSFINLPDNEDDIKLLNKLIEALLKENEFECTAYLCKLLMNIKTQAGMQNNNKSEKTANLIKEYIDTHFAENVTLPLLAEKFHMHPIYLQRKFKNEIGISPTEYIKKIRINHAKAYLISSDLSVEEISEKIGFCNTSYFIKVFKSCVSMTPSQFRQKSLLPNDFL